MDVTEKPQKVWSGNAELQDENVSFSAKQSLQPLSACSLPTVPPHLSQTERMLSRSKSCSEVSSKEGNKTPSGKHLRARSSSKSELSRERQTLQGSNSCFLDRLRAGRSASKPNSRPNSRSTPKRFQSWQMSQVFATRNPVRWDNLTTLTRSEAWALSAGEEVPRLARNHMAAFDPVVEPEQILTIKKNGPRFDLPPDERDEALERQRRLTLLNRTTEPNRQSVGRKSDLAVAPGTEEGGDVIQNCDDDEYFDTGAAAMTDGETGLTGPILDVLFSRAAPVRHDIRRKTKRETLDPPKPPTLKERMDTYYGLPDLSERMAQMHKFYFASGDMVGDDASRQRLKKVFTQFRKGDGTDLLVEDLEEVLQFLGFIVISEDDMMCVLREVTTYDEVDFGEFVNFIENYTAHQFEYWRKLFDEFDEEGSGEVSVSQLRQILSKMGYVVVRPMVEEAIAIVDDGNGELSFEEFVHFLTVYNHTEGFPHQDLESMFKVYHDFAEKRGFKELQSQDLPDALVAVFGLQAENHACTIARLGAPHSMGSTAGITFPDFLMYAKRLRLAEHMDYKAEFEKYDADGSGSIDIQELSRIMKQLGYTPMRDSINEIMREVHFEGDADLDFEEFFHFMMVFRHRDGFTLKELHRLLRVFDKYDYDKSDTIDVHELGDMLRYLGRQVDLEDLRLLVAKVDVNKDGTLDSTEFTRLMRIYREKELGALQDIFDKHRHGNEKLSPYDIPFAIQAYLAPGASPTKLTKTSAKKPVDFDAFVSLADTAQWKKVQSERKKAGFSNSEIQTLRDMFKKYDADGSGDIDALEVGKLLNDFGLKCRTREERQQSLDQVDEARNLAKEAGVYRDETTEDAFMTFWELVQLVRLVKTQQARQSEEQGKSKMQALKFSKQEIDDFRMVFLRWARTDGKRGSIAIGKRQSMRRSLNSQKNVEHMLEDNDASISVGSFQKLIHSLGVHLTLQNKLEIENRIAKAGATNDKGRLTFVGFLQLMQWMIDTNFAGLDAVTSNAG